MFGHTLVILLGDLQVLGVSAVVTSLALEAPGQLRLFLADLLEVLRHVLRQSLKLVPNVRQGASDIVVELLRLVHVSAPLLTVAGNFVDLQPSCYTLAFEKPLFAADLRVNNLLLQHVVLVDDLATTSHLSAEIKVINVIINSLAVLLVHHVCNVGVALQLVSELISIIIAAKAATIITNDRLLKLNAVLDAHFSKSKENLANTLAEARKQLVRGEVNRDAELADLSDNVLGRVHRVVVLVPA